MKTRFLIWNLGKLLLLTFAIGASLGLNATITAERRAEVQQATIRAEQEIVYPTPYACPTPPPGATISCGITR